jgi:hypothetical protein
MDSLKRVPALLIGGGKDTTAGTDDMIALFSRGRAVSAPWALAIEPNATHGDSEEIMMDTEKQLIHPWIAAVVQQRVGTDRGALRDVSEGDGWCADRGSRQVAPWSADLCQSTPHAVNWLPDERAAQGWFAVTHR